MIKYRLYFSKDAETDWLNEMSAKGWAMTGFFIGFYHFEKCEEGKYLYQVDFKTGSVSNEYKQFMQEMNIEIVQSWFFWVFLRKLAAEGEFQLYTDVESKIAHYSKIRTLFKVVAIIEFVCIMMEIMATAAEGNLRIGIPFILLLGAFFVVFLRMAIRTSEIIDELKEQKTGIPVKRHRNVSLFLAVGMLVNSIAVVWNNEAPGPISLFLQIAAIVLMLIGIWDTTRKRER